MMSNISPVPFKMSADCNISKMIKNKPNILIHIVLISLFHIVKIADVKEYAHKPSGM